MILQFQAYLRLFGNWSLHKTFSTTSKDEVEAGYSNFSVSEIINAIRESLVKKHTNKQMARLLRTVPQLSIEISHNSLYGHEFSSKTPIFKRLDELSLGQKCVAILTFIIEVSEFLGDNRPLIIDQPEDHLDNRYIYDYLVQDIRRVKHKRQIILSTHNPNIPVCADAEQIFILKSDGLKIGIDYYGSLDYQEPGTEKEMILYLQEILEGGTEAFKLRKKKYGL